jgi:hypothetical protein
VTEWLRLLISDHLPLTAVGSNPDRDFGFFHDCEEAVQLAYGTSVVLLRCLFLPEIIWPILCQCDVKPNQTNKQTRTPYYICTEWILNEMRPFVNWINFLMANIKDYVKYIICIFMNQIFLFDNFTLSRLLFCYQTQRIVMHTAFVLDPYRFHWKEVTKGFSKPPCPFHLSLSESFHYY